MQGRAGHDSAGQSMAVQGRAWQCRAGHCSGANDTTAPVLYSCHSWGAEPITLLKINFINSVFNPI